MNSLEMEIRLNLKSPLHITGDRHIWGADKASACSSIHRDSYAIPASSLKGHLRSRAEVLLKTWGIEVCHSPEPGSMCSDPADLCLVCRIFGNPRYRSTLRFSEALAPEETISQIRSGVSISRFRRTSIDQRLFFTETVPTEPESIWIAKVTGCFKNAQEAKEAAALVYLAAKSSPAIGGGKSRGLGSTGSWDVKLTLDTQHLSEDDLKPIWQSWEGRKT